MRNTFTTNSGLRRSTTAALAAAMLLPAAGRAADQVSVPSAQMVVSASPVNLMREENPQNPADAEFSQAYADHLAEWPILIEVSIGLVGRQGRVTLSRDGQTWSDQLVFRTTRDGKECPACVVELVPGSDLITIPLEPAQGPFAVGSTLTDGQILESLWTLRVADHDTPPPGLYEILVTPRGGASGHFDAGASFRCDMRIEVLPAGDPDRMVENRVEGLFLTAVAIRPSNPGRAAQHLDAAWSLVQEYLREGAGEANGLYNLTPRYQAARIAEALGRTLDALGYYAQVVQGVARDSKMRFGHFGRERGPLPQTYADHLVVRKVNVLRSTVEASIGAAGAAGR